MERFQQPAASPATIPPGTRLNGVYEVDGLIGTGGMGEIYRGHAIQTGDAVAIKVVRPDLAANAAVLALFRKEATALHNLHHEAIVRYFVFATDPALDRPYLAMEFVDGVALSDVIARGPVPFEQVQSLLRRVADGLTAAHAAGIIHRDISPDNIILPHGDVRRAKIIDFGIARSTAPGDGTVIGNGFAGKYAYVSPEQLGLFGGEVTAKSDIYSLGLVITEALSGRPVAAGTTQADIVEGRRRLPDLGVVDSRLRPLLARMLQPEPANRPDAVQVLETLRQPAARAVEHHAQGRRRWPYAVAALVLLTLGGGAGAYFLLSSPKNEAPQVAVFDERLPTLVPGAPRPEPEQPVETPPVVTPSAPPLEPEVAPTIPSPPPETAERAPEPASGFFDLPSPATPPAPSEVPEQSPLAASPVVAERAGRPETNPSPQFDPPPEVPQSLTASAPEPQIAALPAPAAVPPATFDPIGSFVENYQGGECFYLSLVSSGDKEAVVEGYGAVVEPFRQFDEAFLLANHFEAGISLRQVTHDQCPAVDFVAALPRQTSRPALDLQSFNLRSGEKLAGTVRGDSSKALSVLLVSDDGYVHNLANFIKPGEAGSTFELRIDSPGRQPKPQMVLAIESAAPLGFLSTSGPMAATALFPLLREEVEGRGNTLGVGVRYFRIDG